MDFNDLHDYKMMIFRTHPWRSYLETFIQPITIPDIMEQVRKKYGGGGYQLKLVDIQGRYIKSKAFEIAGEPLEDPSSSEPAEESAIQVELRKIKSQLEDALSRVSSLIVQSS